MTVDRPNERVSDMEVPSTSGGEDICKKYLRVKVLFSPTKGAYKHRSRLANPPNLAGSRAPVLAGPNPVSVSSMDTELRPNKTPCYFLCTNYVNFRLILPHF